MNALRALCLVLLWTVPAYAAPGDPRFLQGTVEWPAVLTGEPLVIVRGDDGHVYSAGLDGARRQGAEVVRVGGRVALLVLEGTRPHEVTAIVIGAGDTVSLSRALAQGALPPPAPAPAPAVTTPATVVVTPPAAPVAAPAAPVTAPPTPVAAPAAPVAAPATPVAAPATPVAAPAVPVAAPAVPVAAPAMPVAAPAAPVAAPATPAATISAPPTPPAVVPSPAPSSPGKATGPFGDRKQWARVDGRVMSVDGALLVLRADNGSLVMVDISQINPNVSSALRRERLVSVYGYPLEQKFEAAGYIELDPSHPEPPRFRQSR